MRGAYLWKGLLSLGFTWWTESAESILDFKLETRQGQNLWPEASQIVPGKSDEIKSTGTFCYDCFDFFQA